MNDFFYKKRFYVIVVLTSLIVVCSLVFAYALRFDLSIPNKYWPRIISLSPVLLVLKLSSFWYFGCFRGWWRYVSMPDLAQLIKANILASLAFLVYSVVIYRLDLIPRTVLFLDGILCFLLLGGIRFTARVFRESFRPFQFKFNRHHTRVLIVGAGDAGQLIARESRSNPHLNFNIVGFIDDDPVKMKGVFQGVEVLGPREQIETIAKERFVDEIIIAIPSATGKEVAAVVEQCRKTESAFRILPSVSDLIDGNVSIQQARDVDLNDLLGREPIHLDEAKISKYIHGKRVLITGAGGSIGSELCRQVARFSPQKLILFENAETPLFLIEQELCLQFPELTIVPIIGDVRNRARVDVIFEELVPQVVFHAAAYKHVPMMEMNPAEAINNNVQGTRILADAASQCGVEKFVMISTDKAVNPANIMGASKRVAELYVQSLNDRSKTNYVTTRFGNVLGSNGSVIPIFKHQIETGGPVTVTHPEVTRFFMTIPEAVQLVLQAGSMGSGGEIYLFDMGNPVKIQTLAEELIRLSGMKPYEDVDIIYTGLRPGEKLYEELLLEGEGVLSTPHSQICIAQSAPPPHASLVRDIEDLVGNSKDLNLDGVRRRLRELVPEYTPTGECDLIKDDLDCLTDKP
jgi:FlaA1/EpsC-like NDP-sugar epimerase